MLDSMPTTLSNAFFILIIITMSSFAVVLFSLRNNSYPGSSARYYLLYFSAGILFWLAHLLKASLFLSMGYSSALVMYLLASMFLLLAVLDYEDNPRTAKIIISMHLLAVLLSLFVEGIYYYILMAGVYTLVVYAVIFFMAWKQAYSKHDIGKGIIGLAGFIAFVVSPIQLYGALAEESFMQIYAMSIILQSIIFTLMGVGVLSSMLNRERKQRKELVLRDPLTGHYTRHGMVHAVEVPLALLRRNEGYIGAVAIEIDSLKEIQNKQGKDAGKLVLVEIGDILRANTRNSDIVCRLEGGKFVVVLPGESVHTELVAERIRSAIEKAGFSYSGMGIKCTVSIGVASQSAIKDFEYLLTTADEALNLAKSGDAYSAP